MDRFYRLLLPLAVRVVCRFRRRLAPRVVRLTRNRIVKFGGVEVLAESQALEYVSAHTTVPVPRVISTFRARDGRYYVLMSRCAGVELSSVYASLPPDQALRACKELKAYMDQLRSLVPPKPGHVGSATYGPLKDHRLVSPPAPIGPFESVKHFHAGITGGFEFPTGHEECDGLLQALQKWEGAETKFTHGDLSFRHVYYDKGHISGIIDWESAGWYPEYWQYVMTWDSFWDAQSYRKIIPDFLTPYQAEAEWEQIRRELFGII